MKELKFLEIINETLSQKSHIGDDCAYLKELGIVITQDSMVEDIHFSRKFSSPYQLAHKAICVNLSDIFASGAVPKYLTISLSLPKDTEGDFIKEFYQACEDLCQKYGIEIIGGDITGSEKIFVSICAIGTTEGRRISSRSHAKVGDLVVTTGVHGSSAAGLWLLQDKIRHPELVSGSHKLTSLINNHLSPIPQKDFSQQISAQIDRDYAMMDTSDGLMDAVFKIAQSSGVQISLDFDKIPYDKEIEDVAKQAGIDFKEWVLYGGEDYQLVACVDEENLKKLKNYTIIGKVNEKTGKFFVEVDFSTHKKEIFDLEKTYNHFGEK